MLGLACVSTDCVFELHLRVRVFVSVLRVRALSAKAQTLFRCSQGVFDRVFLDCELTTSVMRFHELLRKFSLTRVWDRHRADLFIVADLHGFSGRIRWAAILVGGTVCTLNAFLKEDGFAGAALSYKRALSTRRVVWCSTAFKEKHDEIFKITHMAVRTLTCKWVILDNKAAIIRMATQRARSHKEAEVVA